MFLFSSQLQKRIKGPYMYNNEVGFYLNFKKQVKKAIKKSRNESEKKYDSTY